MQAFDGIGRPQEPPLPGAQHRKVNKSSPASSRLSNTPFDFLVLLGGISLVGMMIKNVIVLLDEIEINLAGDKSRYGSMVEAGLSRLRPVMLAAATMVQGVAPLLQNVFWLGLGVTVIAGLTFGTVLIMILVPVLYATLYRLKPAAA